MKIKVIIGFFLVVIPSILFSPLIKVEAARIPIEEIFQMPSGNSSSYIDGDQVVLTRDWFLEYGQIFSTEQNKFNLNESFHLETDLYFGNNGENAGEGTAFVITTDKERVEHNPYGYGITNAYQLGIYANTEFKQYLKRSFAIEFDTHQEFSLDTGVSVNDGKGHVANSFPGQRSSYIFSGNFLKSLKHNDIYYPTEYLADNKWHPFTIDWDADKKILSYKYDEAPVVNVPIDPITVFGDTSVYWGFSARTGWGTPESLRVSKQMVRFKQITNKEPEEPGFVDIYDRLMVTKDGKEITNTGVTSKSGPIRLEYDLTYIGGNQDLLTPTFNLTLDDNLSLKEGTLNVNGSKVSDSYFTGNKLSYTLLGNLNTTNRNLNISFEAIPKELKINSKTKIDYQLKAANYLGGNLTLEIPIWKMKPKLTIQSQVANLNLEPTDFEQIKAMTNEQIIDYVVAQVGVTAKDTVYDTNEGISFAAANIDEFNRIKTLEVGGSETLTLYAEKLGVKSTELPIVLSLNAGILSFREITNQLDFIQKKNIAATFISQRKEPFNLVIEDTREIGSTWELSASSSGLFDGNRKLNGSIIYKIKENDTKYLNEDTQKIQSGIRNEKQIITNIAESWSPTEGPLLQINAGNLNGKYVGEILWILSSAP